MSTVWIDTEPPGKSFGTGPHTGSTLDGMTAPEPDTAARVAAIQATEGSADDIFEPGYLQALREDWTD